jgi:putative Mg2+ transporter-C (MgtC) family protein
MTVIEIDHLLYLVTAAGLGSMIGLEREIHGQPAGLRTHMILSTGAALAAILSIAYSAFISNPALPSDPGRIVAQVVSGVGFLGAGAIMKMGVTVKGLTTASSLWTTAIIGIACGSGYLQLAGAAAVLVFVILTIINRLEKAVLTSYGTHTLKVVLDDRPGIIKDIRKMLEARKVKLVSLSASMPDRDTLKLSMVIRKPSDLGMDSLINSLTEFSETRSMDLD